ncbi:MAG TPA: ribonuclease H-like domain-containing protein [Candidatus Acidoferrales bacterium]|nr:ribonuclease H-like domain-containing protein [Candidatus Acidoferrales bacterium]
MSDAIPDRLASLAALRPARRTPPNPPRGLAPELPESSARLAELVGAQPRSNRFGEHLAVRRWFSDPIDAPPEETPLPCPVLRLLSPDAPEDAADPQTWLFLDTETTGTAGGSGTYAFLVGIAWWDAGGLEVEQFFMRDHSEEHAVLVSLAERLAERRVLVTFNGKSFDWPLLETRYRMTRSILPPRLRAHLDFLHPARHLWRLRLGSVRLAELERHVLGWNRGADVMSELIPAIYYDYLRGGAAEPLVPVFHHNQMDLRGLAGLALRVLALLSDPETHGRDAFELFGVSRICDRRGDSARARKLYARSIAPLAAPESSPVAAPGALNPPNPADPAAREAAIARQHQLPEAAGRIARRALARLAKREGDLAAACEMWHAMLGNSREGLEAYEQLAVHYEHRVRDLDRALGVTRRALAELRRSARLGIIAPSEHRQACLRFQHRLARLERKSALSSAPLLQP